MPIHHLKPAHQPIKEYYAALVEYRGHDVTHELAVKTVFQRLLEVTARKQDWHLVPEQPTTVRGKSICPDGTLRDSFNLHRGYWEAKDSGDTFDGEICKMTKRCYPLRNMIFEDTRVAVLYQNGHEVEPRSVLTHPQQFRDFLNQPYIYAEPTIVA